MRSKYTIGIVITLIIMGVLFYKDRPENPLQSPVDTEEAETTESAKKNEKSAEQVIEKQASDSKLKEKATAVTDEQTLEIQKDFAAHLKELGRCLEVQPANVETADPTFESLSSSLKPALGEVVVRMYDWTQEDFKTEDGDLRRIRTEVEYQDSGVPVKRAQLFKINAQGMPEMQNINPEKSVDPTDEFLSSLRGDGQTTVEEKGGRVYYQEGEELVLVERGGKIQSFSLTKGQKTFSCTETDATNSNCQCL